MVLRDRPKGPSPDNATVRSRHRRSHGIWPAANTSSDGLAARGRCDSVAGTWCYRSHPARSGRLLVRARGDGGRGARGPGRDAHLRARSGALPRGAGRRPRADPPLRPRQGDGDDVERPRGGARLPRSRRAPGRAGCVRRPAAFRHDLRGRARAGAEPERGGVPLVPGRASAGLAHAARHAQPAAARCRREADRVLGLHDDRAGRRPAARARPSDSASRRAGASGSSCRSRRRSWRARPGPLSSPSAAPCRRCARSSASRRDGARSASSTGTRSRRCAAPRADHARHGGRA